MEPRPSQSGGSLLAKSGAGVAAFISVGGTSVRVCARRSTVFVRPEGAGVWQIGKSEVDAAGATVALAAPISTPPPASMTFGASHPRETPPKTSAVVENRASRERRVIIPSKPRRDGPTCFTHNLFAEPTCWFHACHVASERGLDANVITPPMADDSAGSHLISCYVVYS